MVRDLVERVEFRNPLYPPQIPDLLGNFMDQVLVAFFNLHGSAPSIFFQFFYAAFVRNGRSYLWPPGTGLPRSDCRSRNMDRDEPTTNQTMKLQSDLHEAV